MCSQKERKEERKKAFSMKTGAVMWRLKQRDSRQGYDSNLVPETYELRDSEQIPLLLTW